MGKIRQRLFLTFVALLAQSFLFLPLWAQEQQTPPVNVAIVNGKAISQNDFDREMKDIQQRLMKMGKSVGNDQLQEFKKDVLEALIDRELLYQESQNSGIKIEDTVINKQFSSLKNRFPSEEDFKNALRDMELSEAELTTRMRHDLAIQKFIKEKFNDTLTVPEEETKLFYDNNPDAFKERGELKASQILIKVDPKADKAQRATAHKKIEEIQKKINKGADFTVMAKEFSEGPNRADGGDLGFFGPGEMPKPFEKAAFALAPGEISDIVETRLGYHIIKSVDKKPGATIAYKDVKEDLQQYLKQKKLQEQLMTYTDELKKKGKVERLMKKSS